jgi:hypothetical protein
LSNTSPDDDCCLEGDDDDLLEDVCDEYEDKDEIADLDYKSLVPSSTNLDPQAGSELSLDALAVPTGWLSYVDRFGRRVYYNEFDQSKVSIRIGKYPWIFCRLFFKFLGNFLLLVFLFKWFLAFNEHNAKPYFYNTEHQSVWQLPEIRIEQQQNQHFNRIFDEELSTFKTLNSKYSLTKNPDEVGNRVDLEA